LVILKIGNINYTFTNIIIAYCIDTNSYLKLLFIKVLLKYIIVNIIINLIINFDRKYNCIN